MKQNVDWQRSLLLLMGRILPVVYQAEPLPGHAWGEWFTENIQTCAPAEIAREVQAIAPLVKRAVRASTYQESDALLWKALRAMQALVGVREMGVYTDDPHWIGRQVAVRSQEEEATITYGHITSSLIFLEPGEPADCWVVSAQSGGCLQADSRAFVCYDGPLYQPGVQVLYQDQGQTYAATILKPRFSVRGSLGFDIVFSDWGRAQYRYALPATKFVSPK